MISNNVAFWQMLTQTSLKQRNSKWCSVSSLTLIEYSSDLQRLWSDSGYAQADLRFCWPHIQHCWKSHFVAHLCCMYICLMFIMLWGLFIVAFRSPAGKGLTYWLSFVMLNCVLVTFPCVSWVRCGFDCNVSWSVPCFLLCSLLL